MVVIHSKAPKASAHQAPIFHRVFIWLGVILIEDFLSKENGRYKLRRTRILAEIVCELVHLASMQNLLASIIYVDYEFRIFLFASPQEIWLEFWVS
jgi:hypothetical protein